MNFRVVYIIVVALLAVNVVSSFAQTAEEAQKLAMQQALNRQRSVTLQFDSAILLSHQGNYLVAEKKFLYVLKTMRSIPTDLTYHFGVNSFYLGKFKQSIDWLNKYIQLKGTSGQYSEKTADYLARAQEALLQEQEADREKAAVVLSNNYDIDCGPAGKVTCPVCGGTTVVVKKGYINETFKTCTFCKKTGFLSCEDYNKLIRGELKPEN